MAEWKGGKADRYGRAVNMINSIKAMQDTENIKANLRGYINRVKMGSEAENEFLRHEITKAYKKNTFIGRALEEMSGAEKNTLFESSSEPEGRKVNTYGGLTKEEIDEIGRASCRERV